MVNRKHAPEHEDLDIPSVDPTRMKYVGRGLMKDKRMSLKGVREAFQKTQIDVATAADMNQSEISRLEQREDSKISTLRRYVEALGGELEVRAVFKKTGHSVSLDI